MGADGLLPALRGCHVRRWRWFIKTRRNRCRSRNCFREGVSAFFITVGAGNGPVATDGTSAPACTHLAIGAYLLLSSSCHMTRGRDHERVRAYG